MALIKCPNCKEPVSDKAAKCPHCGIDVQKTLINKEKRKDNLVLIVLIAIALIALILYLNC